MLASGAGGSEFGSRPGHTEDYNSNDLLSFALRAVRLTLRLTRWCQAKWTSSTGNIHRKRRDETGILLKAE